MPDPLLLSHETIVTTLQVTLLFGTFYVHLSKLPLLLTIYPFDFFLGHITATETRLTPYICSSEFLPSNYIAYCKDRMSGLGGSGVMIAHNNSLLLHETIVTTLQVKLLFGTFRASTGHAYK